MHLMLALMISVCGNAKTLFEGYFRIEVKGKHAGYFILRDEIDETTKTRRLNSLFHKEVGGRVTENALTEVSRAIERQGKQPLFAPVKYTYFGALDRRAPAIDGEFKRELELTNWDVKTGKLLLPSRAPVPIPADAMFSTMVLLNLAADPSSYVEGLDETYTALSEDDGSFGEGRARVYRTRMIGSVKIAQVLVESDGETVEWFTFGDGQPLGMRDAGLDLIVKLVPQRELALGKFRIPRESAKTVFGLVPFGMVNRVSESSRTFDAGEIIKSFKPPAQNDDSIPPKPEVRFKWPSDG